MSVTGQVVRGFAKKVRCDGCGRLSSDRDGYYFDKKLQRGGTISSKGRECRHDYCNECESKNPDYTTCPACIKESTAPQDTKPVAPDEPAKEP